MTFVLIAASILSTIMVWRLIGFGVRSANQINRSTAAAAAALQAIDDAMPPEAPSPYCNGNAGSRSAALYQIPLIRTRGPMGAVRWT